VKDSKDSNGDIIIPGIDKCIKCGETRDEYTNRIFNNFDNSNLRDILKDDKGESSHYDNIITRTRNYLKDFNTADVDLSVKELLHAFNCSVYERHKINFVKSKQSGLMKLYIIQESLIRFLECCLEKNYGGLDDFERMSQLKIFNEILFRMKYALKNIDSPPQVEYVLKSIIQYMTYVKDSKDSNGDIIIPGIDKCIKCSETRDKYTNRIFNNFNNSNLRNILKNNKGKSSHYDNIITETRNYLKDY